MIGLGGEPLPPTRWEAVEGVPVPAREHTRDEIRDALRFLNPGAGYQPGMVRQPLTGERWISDGSRGRRARSMPTTLIRQLVEGGYAAITNSTPTTEASGSRWVAVPRRVMGTGKGLERR